MSDPNKLTRPIHRSTGSAGELPNRNIKGLSAQRNEITKRLNERFGKDIGAFSRQPGKRTPPNLNFNV